jgi:hypothetical protein
MRFRAGLVVGLAAGYVLGTRAGRERYEQIRRLYGQAQEHPAVRQLVDQATAVVDLGRTAVAEGLETGSKGLRKTAAPPHTA